jgi:hypothetical protein
VEEFVRAAPAVARDAALNEFRPARPRPSIGLHGAPFARGNERRLSAVVARQGKNEERAGARIDK